MSTFGEGYTTLHCHYEKAGLILDIVKRWPAPTITGPDGEPFDSVRDAVQAVLDVSTKFVPVGCPTPAEDGTCPGHRPDGTARPTKDWLILCVDEIGHGEVGLWWKPEARGYTRDLSKAGRWTEEAARARARAGCDMAVRLADVEAGAYPVVPLDKIEGAWDAIQKARR